jgi:hypothetical protein
MVPAMAFFQLTKKVIKGKKVKRGNFIVRGV